MCVTSAVRSVVRGTIKAGIVTTRYVESTTRSFWTGLKEIYAEARAEVEQPRRAPAPKAKAAARRPRRKRYATAAGTAD